MCEYAHAHVYMYTVHVNSDKAKQSNSEDNSFRKNELPQAGFKPTCTCTVLRGRPKHWKLLLVEILS